MYVYDWRVIIEQLEQTVCRGVLRIGRFFNLHISFMKRGILLLFITFFSLQSTLLPAFVYAAPANDSGAADPVAAEQPASAPVVQEAADAPSAAPQALAGEAPPVGHPEAAIQSQATMPGLDVKADHQTGALTYEYPLTVPPGRNGLQPQLSLVYNNQDQKQNSIVGYGWSFSIPSIERTLTYGTNNLYTGSTTFRSSLSGELVEMDLVDDQHGEYGVSVESGDFLQYEFTVNNEWTVTDKRGTVYRFGLAASSRQSDAANASHTYKWMLTEARDVNDNVVSYEYTQHTGQIYPARIVYAGNGNQEGIFEVLFTLENRPDVNRAYNAGFLVQTSKRIAAVEARVSGVWKKQYDLRYTAGDNGVRSLLAGITERGRDDQGQITTLPDATFDYSQKEKGWSPSNFWGLGPFLNIWGQDENGERLVDLQGDGYPDVFSSYDSNGTITTRVIQNQLGNGWAESIHVRPPAAVGTIDSSGQDIGVRFADVDGDGKADIVQDYLVYGSDPCQPVTHSRRVLRNQGNGRDFFEVPTYQFPQYYRDDDTHPYGFTDSICFSGRIINGIQLLDANGDGLSDIIEARTLWFGRDVYLNNGDDTGWTYSPNFVVTMDFTNEDERFLDLNGDGLVDILKNESAFINTGSRWVADNSFVGPERFTNNIKWDIGTRIMDVNGDGIMDFLRTDPTVVPQVNKVYIGDGNGHWAYDPEYTVPDDFIRFHSYMNRNKGLRIDDINGDGLQDIIGGQTAGFPREFINNGVKPDLLTTIGHPTGAQTSVTYKPSTQYKNAQGNVLNPNLSQVLFTAQAIVTDDGAGNIATSTYSFEGGELYFQSPYDKQFAGFEKVIATDAEGNKTVYYYHQGDNTDAARGEVEDHKAKIGRMYREEKFDDAGNLYAVTINDWERADLNPGQDTFDIDRNFIYLSKTVVQTFDGNASHIDSAQEGLYDLQNGNLLVQTEYGEVTGNNDGTFVDVGTDKKVTTYTYAAGQDVTGFPSTEIVTDSAGTKIKETKLYYDNLPLHQVAIGNNTKQEAWIVGNTYASTLTSHNNYGLVTSQTDSNGEVTQYTYDAFQLYPQTSTNALNQVRAYTYNYLNGKPVSVVDANGYTSEFLYDGLGRPTAERIPNPTCVSPGNCQGASIVDKTIYTYTDNTFPRVIHRTDYLDDATAVQSYTYLNGYDTPIQARKQGEAAGIYIVKEYTYTPKMQLATESLPYESAGSGQTAPNGNNALITTHTYDALSRPLMQTNVLGTTSFAYDQWQTTVTDSLNNVKVLRKDAFDRLIGVDEYTGGAVYQTVYEYNHNNALTKIIDALGNVRNFAYDGLGRRTQAEDLHAVGDGTYGMYSYVYDNQGNILEEQTPNQDTVYYTYDALHRPTAEALNTPEAIQTEYTYDDCQNGIGRVCQTLTAEVLTQYAYDSIGNITQESRTVDGIAYDVLATSAFDRQGNIQSIQYPDSTSVIYGYNTAGLLEQVTREGVSIISNIDYNPLFQVKRIVYGNGAESVSTYDAAELYRLRQKRTFVAGQQDVQNITYTYDAVGNVTRMVDASNTLSSKTSDFTYDDLYRLTRATVSNAGNGQNYARNYSYDASGNILNKSDQGAYLYQGNQGDSSANPHAVTSVAGVQIDYDRNGNMTGDGAQTYSWNYKNRLLESENAGTGAVTTYGYDHDGQRVYKTSDAGTTIYPNKYMELRNGSVIQYVYAGIMAIATVEDGALFYNHTDHLSGSNVVTDEQGDMNQVLDYYPFGSVRIDEQVSDHDEKKKFTGYELDDESGLYYAQARYYGSDMGRFVSVDPVHMLIGVDKALKKKTGMKMQELLANPQLLNSYAYSANNPYKYVDTDGEFIFAAALAFVAASTLATAGPLAVGASYSYAHGDAASGQAYTGATMKMLVFGLVGSAAVLGVGTIGAGLGVQSLAEGCLVMCGTVGQDAPKLLNSTIHITQDRLKHVYQTHTGIYEGKAGVFNKGEDIVSLIRSTTQAPLIPQNSEKFARILDAGRNIGIDRVTSEQTSIITVITDAANKLITSYPGVPGHMNRLIK